MKNIGIVTEWFERGAGIVSKMYAERLTTGSNVFIFARGEGKRQPQTQLTRDLSVQWGYYDKMNPTYLNKRQFFRWVRANNIDTLIFNEQQDWNIVWALREELHEVRIGAYIDFYTQYTVPLFALYDFLVCNTKRHYSVFDWHPQCYYLPWGTSVKDFVGNRNSDRPGTHDAVVFFHSCGMNPHRKGTANAVHAFSALPREYAARLVIHTQVDLAKYLDPATLDLVRKDDRIDVIKKTVPIPGLYGLGDVYVYPTRLEGIGLTIAEALMSGLPVVLPDAPPMNEFVVDGFNGRLVKVAQNVARADGYYWPESIVDVGDLRQSLEFFLKDKSELLRMKKNAVEFAESNLDWEKRDVAGAISAAKPIRRELMSDSLERAFLKWKKGEDLETMTLLKRVAWNLIPVRVKEHVVKPKNLINFQ